MNFGTVILCKFFGKQSEIGVRNRILENGLNFSAQTVLLGLGISTLVNHVPNCSG